MGVERNLRTSDNNDRSRSFVLKAGVGHMAASPGLKPPLIKETSWITSPTQAVKSEPLLCKTTPSLWYFAFNVGDGPLLTVLYHRGANGRMRRSTWSSGRRHDKPGNRLPIQQPVFRNCAITRNYAREGGMLNLAMKRGLWRPTISHCSFINNKADLDGGAI